MDYRQQKTSIGLSTRSSQMVCLLCKDRRLQKYKKVKGVGIYICQNCGVSILKKENARKRPTVLYDFKSYDKNIQRLKDSFGQLADEIHRFKSAGSVLDIGGGFGLLSMLLHACGQYDLEVLEPEVKPYYLEGQKYTLHQQSIENFLAKQSPKKYDLIVMFDVIEHLTRPLVVLEKLQNVLSEHGVVIIQTPNYKSLMQVLVDEWSWWMVDDHRFLFSARSFKEHMQKTGFKVRYFRTYERWYDFKKNLDGNFTWIKNKFLRKLCKGIYFLFFSPFYFILREVVWRLGYGGLIFAVVEKA